jgi:tripartite-type tricarboxylate transporter receptor subunit TctC
VKLNRFPPAFAFAAMAFASTAHAQTYPTHQVKIVVPYPTGGAVDAVVRRIAQQLTIQTGQTFYVENKPGAAGTLGAAYVAQSANDGYTLLGNDFTYAILPHIFKKLPFKYDDLTPLAGLLSAPMAAAVATNSKYKTLKELVDDAHAHPGELTFGTGGPGTIPHFSTEAFGLESKSKFMHIPFKGAGEATIALLTGTINFEIATTPGLIGQVKGGKVRILGISAPQRLAVFPDAPTFAEAGFPQYSVTNDIGLWAPKNVPAAVMTTLQDEIAKAVNSAGVKSYADAIGATPKFQDSRTFGKNVAGNTALWGKVAEAIHFERQ